MPSVDNRIVSLKFDNKQFLDGVRSTLNALKSLNDALKLKMPGAAFDKTKNSVSSLNKELSTTDLSKLSGNVDTVASRFTNMGIVGVTALQNITNRAMAAGEQLVKSFTVDPVKMGFQEYETQINSVQTILANTESKGTTLNDVTAALDELNHYADMTIYNFTEMTRNIGTFTAAGVDLDTSVAAIKGIANLAAVSGSNSQQASTAMYQLSQALASGTVKLMDWNSVVNAGMGGQVFQDALKETARAHGIAIDEIIKKQGSFRETLQEGWLSSEILTETLSKFTGDLSAEQLKSMGYTEKQVEEILRLGEMANDAATKVKTFTQLMDTLKEAAQSGWTQSWEIIIGDFEEAKKFLTELSDVFSAFINQSSEARNAVLQGWKDDGGRDMLIESLRNSFEALLSLLRPVKQALSEVFPPITSQTLLDMTRNLRDFTKSLIIGGDTAENIKNVFKAIFSVFKIVGSAASIAAKAVGELIKIGMAVLNVILYPIGDISRIFSALVDYLFHFVDGFKNLLRDIASMDSVVMLFETLRSIFNSITDVVGSVYQSFRTLAFGLTDKTFDASALVFSKIAEGVNFLAQILNGAISKIAGFVSSLKDLPIATELISKLSEVFDTLRTNVSTVLSMVKSGLVYAFESLVRTIGNFANQAKDLVKNFTGIVSWSDLLSKAQNFLVGVFQNGISIFQNANESFANIISNLQNFGSISFDNLVNGFESLKERIGDLVTSSDKLPKIKEFVGSIGEAFSGILGTSSDVIVKFKESLLEFVNWLKDKIGSITLGDIIAAGAGASLIAFFLSMARLASSASKIVKAFAEVADGFSDFGKNVNKVVKSTGSFIKAKANEKNMEAISGLIKSVALLAASLALLSRMDQASVRNSAIVIGVLLAAIIAMVVGMSAISKKLNGVNTEEISKTLAALASSVLALAIALKIIAGIDTGKIVVSVVAIGIIMAEMAGFMILMSKTKAQFIKGSSSLVAISASIILLGIALRSLSKIGLESVAKALLIVTSLMGFLGLASKLSARANKWSVVGIVAIAVSMLLMVQALKKLSKIKPETIIPSLIQLIAITGLIATLFIATQHVGWNAAKGGIAILLISASMIIIADAIKKVAEIDQSMITQASGTIVAILAMFAVMTGMTKFAGKHAAKAGAGIAMMTSSMVLLALAMAIMSKLDPSGLARAQLCVMGIMGMFAILVEATRKSRDASKTIREFTIAIGILAGALAILSLINPEGLAASTIALDSLILCFAILVGVTKFAGKTKKLKKTILIFAGVIALLAVLLKALSNLPGEDTAGVAIGIAALILALTESMVLLQKLVRAPSFKTVGKSIAALVMVIAAFGALFAGLGALNKNVPELQGFVESGIPLLSAIGKGVGEFIGSLVGGLVGGFAEASLGGIANGLTSFMQGIQGFLNGLKNVDNSMLDGAGRLAGIVALITASEFLTGISNFLGGSDALDKFADKIPVLGTALTEFATNTSGINAEKLDPALRAIEAFANLFTALSGEGGLWQNVVGSKTESLKALVEHLTPMGDGLKDFQQSVSGLTTDGIDPAFKILTLLADYLNYLSINGGLVGMLSGDKLNTLKGIVDNLSSLGGGLKDFQGSVAGIGTDGIDIAFKILRSIGDFFNSLNISGGLGGILAGDQMNTFEGVVNRLLGISAFIKVFQKNVSGITDDGIDITFKILRSIGEFFNSLEVSGGLGAIFAGDKINSLEGIISRLPGISAFVKLFQESVSGISDDGIDITFKILRSISEFFNSLEVSGGLSGIFSGDKINSLEGIISRLPDLGKGLSTIQTSFSGVNSDGVETSLYILKSIGEFFNSLEVSGGLGAIFAGDKINSLEGIISRLPGIGAFIKKFQENVSGISGEGAGPALSILKEIGIFFNSLETSGGLGGAFKGDKVKSLSGIIEGLPNLGEGIGKFQEAVSGIKSSEGADTVFSILTGISTFFNSLEDSGGFAASFSGNKLNTFAGIAEYMPALGAGIKSFQNVAAGINKNGGADFSFIAPILMSISEFFKSLEISGSITEVFTGSKLTTFISIIRHLPLLAESLSSLSTITSGEDQSSKLESLTRSVGAIKVLCEALSYLPSSGGVDGMFNGDMINTIKEGIPALAEAFTAFNSKFNGVEIDFTKISTVVRSLNALSSIVSNVESFSTVSQIGTSLQSFGDSYKKFYDIAALIDPMKIESFISTYNNLKSNLTDFGPVDVSGLNSISDAMKDITNSFNAGGVSIGNSISQMISDAGNSAALSVAANSGRFSNAGGTLIHKFCEGIKKNNPKISSTINAGLNAAKGAIKVNILYNVGSNVAAGFANGIRNGAYKATAAARYIAGRAVTAAEKRLDENSPSKVFIRIGEYATEGMAIGLTRVASHVQYAAESVGDKAIDSTQDAVTKIYSAFDQDLNYEPTITPVIDGSKIDSGISRINSKMSSLSGFGIQAANIGATFNSLSANSDSAKMDKLVNAISKMQTPNTPSNTYVMNGVTYDDGSNIANAMQTIAHEIKLDRRS